MMKKYSFILWVALTMTSVFIACTDNDNPMSEQTDAKTATIRATIDGDLGSRVALIDDATNRVVKVHWKEGDAFKIKVNGVDYTFTYTDNDLFECGNFPTAFPIAEKLTATYLATNPTGGYASQPGTLESAAALLTMTATLEVTAGQNTEDLALNFKHNNSIVKMTLSNEDFKGQSVTSISLNSGNDAVYTATGDFTGDAENGSIVVYFAVTTQEMTNISIHAVCGESNYITTLIDNTLGTGKLYNVNKTLVGLKNAGQAVKGDLAMADGTFISKDDIENLTDALKGKVRGIVFWTESEDGTATLLGDNADKIMQTEFEHCNHGLIVALTNVSAGCTWANPYEYIYDNFQNTNNFNPTNKSDYKSIASYRMNQYAPENYQNILGFQNTKVLEAYNTYCSKTPGKEGYKVNLVEELAIWETSNPAPENTTGWFIPSVKELQMLCHKDDSFNEYGTETRELIDALIDALGGTTLGEYKYWASLELSTNDSAAFGVGFDYGIRIENNKSVSNYVRAVCAF